MRTFFKTVNLSQKYLQKSNFKILQKYRSNAPISSVFQRARYKILTTKNPYDRIELNGLTGIRRHHQERERVKTRIKQLNLKVQQAKLETRRFAYGLNPATITQQEIGTRLI